MSSSKVNVVGAGIPGMVAAINLAKEGYEVLVMERGSQVGKSPYTPRLDVTPLDKPMVWDYIGLDLSPCFKELKGNIYIRSHCFEFTPPNIYGVERSAREGSIDNHLYQEALKTGVKFEFSTYIKGPNDLPGNSIIATGSNPQMLEALEIPTIPVYGYWNYMEKPKVDRSGVFNAYLDEYTAGYYYSVLVNDIWYSLLFDAYSELGQDALDRCAQQVKEREGQEIKEWRRVQFAVACRDLNNPRLFAGNKILAGPLSGLHDPFLGFGVVAAMLSGKTAAIAVKDKERALKDFKKFNRNFERTWLIRKAYEAVTPNIRLSLADLVLSNPELFEPLIVGMGGIVPGHPDTSFILQGLVKEPNAPYFDKAKESLAKFLSDNMARFL